MQQEQILETIKMIDEESLDIRTITMGISLLDCADADIDKSCRKIEAKIMEKAKDLVRTGNEIAKEFGIPIVNKRIAVTPISLLLAVSGGDPIRYAKTLEKCAIALGVDFIGGYSALVEKGYAAGDKELIESIPKALSQTEHVCASVNIGTTKAGLNMDAIKLMGKIIKECSKESKENNCMAAAKLVVFCNAPTDNPFMAGAFHGIGERDVVINVGVSGPGVVRAALSKLDKKASMDEVADLIKKTAFKITRMGQLVGKEAGKRLNIPFGIVDISLAPTPAKGDSVANILEEMGLQSVGAYGTTAALALLNDAVKKGGVMATSHVGGLSGAFIPVSEDAGMIEGVKKSTLNLEKLEAMTAVCSVGLDMIVVEGDIKDSILSGIIADEAAIGMVNSKTTAVRIIPAMGKKIGETIDFGGLLGSGIVMPCNRTENKVFIDRKGRIPAPIQALKN